MRKRLRAIPPVVLAWLGLSAYLLVLEQVRWPNRHLEPWDTWFALLALPSYLPFPLPLDRTGVGVLLDSLVWVILVAVLIFLARMDPALSAAPTSKAALLAPRSCLARGALIASLAVLHALAVWVTGALSWGFGFGGPAGEPSLAVKMNGVFYVLLSQPPGAYPLRPYSASFLGLEGDALHYWVANSILWGLALYGAWALVQLIRRRRRGTADHRSDGTPSD